MRHFMMKGMAVFGVVLGGFAAHSMSNTHAPAIVPVQAGTACEARAQHGGGLDLRPRLVQASLFSGTTNTGTQPSALFRVRNADAETVRAIADKLKEGARFTDAAGTSISAKISFERSRMPSYEFDVTLAPESELRPDTAYTLSIDRDLSFVVGGHEDPLVDDGKATRDTDFFTGSAPRIRRILRSADPSKGLETFDVILSEPVALGALSRGFRVFSGSQRLGGCVAWEGGCAKADSRAVVNAFSFRLSSPVRGKAPSDVTFALGGEVRGQGRSVAEGAVATRATLDTSLGQVNRVSPLAASDWKNCSSDGDTVCWNAPAR